jgi:hypothetical protein
LRALKKEGSGVWSVFFDPKQFLATFGFSIFDHKAFLYQRPLEVFEIWRLQCLGRLLRQWTWMPSENPMHHYRSSARTGAPRLDAGGLKWKGAKPLHHVAHK